MMRADLIRSHAMYALIAIHLLVDTIPAQNSELSAKGNRFPTDTNQQGSDTGFMLKISVSECKGCVAIISYDGVNGEVLDSNTTAANMVTFTGMLSEPQPIILKLHNGNSLSEYELFLANGEQVFLSISGDGGEFSVEGSQAHLDYDAYRKTIAPVIADMERMDSLHSVALKAGNGPTRDSLRALISDLSFKKQQLTTDFVKQHPTSAVGVYALVTTFYHNFDPRLLEDALNAIDDEYRQLKDWKYLLNQILGPAKATSVGVQAPSIDMIDIVGHKLTLENLQGRFVLIDFWASWCVPCRAENKELAELHAKYQDSGLAIVSISLDTEEVDWRNASEEDGIVWVNYFDGKAFGNAAAKTYGVKAIPARFLVNPDGNIVLRYPIYRDLERYLDSAVK